MHALLANGLVVLLAAGLQGTELQAGPDKDPIAEETQEFEAGYGKLVTTVAENFTQPARVAIDGVCPDETSLALFKTISTALEREGVAVDPKAETVLRYSTEPCEASFRIRPNPATREALRGTSDIQEIPDVTTQVKIRLGKRAKPSGEVAMSMLLFRPGASPIWAGEAVAGRSSAGRIEQLQSIARALVETLGEAAEMEIRTP